MARYDSHTTEQPGQYPATAWTQIGLPAQNEGSGAGGSPPFSSEVDKGTTNEPGQYPGSMPLAGTALDGSGAPGSAGVSGGTVTQGADSVTWTSASPFKSAFLPEAAEQGPVVHQTGATISGDGDWTQANSAGYRAPARYQMPGTAQVRLDAGGDGTFQPGAGQVRRGGNMNGQR